MHRGLEVSRTLRRWTPLMSKESEPWSDNQHLSAPDCTITLFRSSKLYYFIGLFAEGSVVDPDTVGFERFWSYPDC